LSYPAISIIVPVYNTQDYLAECLDSILAQTFIDFEVLCVNDGSTDASASILAQYAADDQRLTVVSQVNQGAGVARNAGIDLARGKYIIFLDSDDWSEPTFLAKLYARAEQTGSDITICIARQYNQPLGEYTANRGIAKTEIQKQDTWSLRDFPKNFYGLVSTLPFIKLYRREFLIKHGIRFEGSRTADDVYFYLTSMGAANKISFVFEPLVNYRIFRPDGALTSWELGDYFAASRRAIILAEKKLQQIIPNYLFEQLHDNLLNYQANNFFRVYKMKATNTSDDFLTICI
jgi:glycosyltransferase involved in cell wall biosynthesis